MAVLRSNKNPIITPQDVKPSRDDFEVICAFNAGVTRVGDETILLLRVAERPINTDPGVYLSPYLNLEKGELDIHRFSIDEPGYDFSDSRLIKSPEGLFLTSISHLRVARSKDGLNFKVEEKPAMFPVNQYEMYGTEDPRITSIDGVYYINYSAISKLGITTCLASTVDFREFKHHGAIFNPDNKDVALFPQKINGKYYALHRPASATFKTLDIWIAESPDLICWGNHRYLMGTRNGMWDDGRVGASAVPFKIDEGWLHIYHGADKNDKYCLGAVLLDENEPWKIIGRSRIPVMEPEAEYERKGFFGNVIFNCGVLLEDDMVKIYYGAADTCMAFAETSVKEILESMY